MKYFELTEKRGKAYDKMRDIIAESEEAGKLTKVQKEEFARAESEFDFLTRQIKLEQAEQERKAEPSGKITKINFDNSTANRALAAGGNSRPVLGEAAFALVNGERTSTGFGNAQKRAFSTTGTTASISTDMVGSEIIPALEHDNALVAAGARILRDVDYKKLPKITGTPTASWIAENAESSIDSTFALSAPKWDFETLRVIPIQVSREWFSDSDALGMAVVNNGMNVAINNKLIETAFNGTGTNQPVGIDNYSGVNFVNAAGALADYEFFGKAMKKCLLDQASLDRLSVIYGPEVAGQLAILQDLDNNPLQVPPVLANMGWHYTYGITQAEAEAYVGDFSTVIWGLSPEVRIQLDERYAEFNQVGFVAYVRADIVITRPEHICKILGITAAAPTT